MHYSKQDQSLVEQPNRHANGHIVEWNTTEEMLQGFSVIQQMYTKMTREDYQARLNEITHFNYRQFAFISEEGQCLAVTGLWLFPRLWCGLQADIDNFVVDQSMRGMGLGKQLLDHCHAYALEHGAQVIVLDAFVGNFDAHRFYYREGFTARGYHFVKPLSVSTQHYQH